MLVQKLREASYTLPLLIIEFYYFLNENPVQIIQ